MFKINDNYLKLPGSYLFSTIGKKVAAYSAAHPEKEIIRLDVDLLSCDGQVYKPQDWGRTYVKQGIEELDKIM